MSKRLEDPSNYHQKLSPLPKPVFPRTGWWLVFCALWGLQILVVANGRYLGMKLWGETVSWSDAFKASLFNYGFWAPVSLAAFMLVRHFPFGRPHLARNLFIHLGAAVAFVFARVAVSAVVAPHVDWLTDISLRDRLVYEAPSFALYYLLLLGAASAIVYYGQARSAEVQASRSEAQLANAQLQRLRSQLNPHFFFNALNSVAMLVRQERNADAVHLIAGLGDLLRDFLRESHVLEVPLHQELAFAERYLAIEQVRFPDRLRYTIDVAPEALNALAPNLILQPLVENAVRHGIAKRSKAGEVRLAARIHDGHLEVRVSDDGPGMKAAAPPEMSSGVGLRNTCERLERMYGADSRLSLEESPGGGTVATLVLPYHTRPISGGMAG